MLSEISKIPKELIIDASILFSFFKKASSRRKVIKKLLDIGCELFAPEYVLEELVNNKSDIMHFAKISEFEFNELFGELNKDIEKFEEEEYSRFLLEANKLSPHGGDTKDDPYFALSLSLNKCPIWSDEPAFKQQSEIKVFGTKEILELLSREESEEDDLEEIEKLDESNEESE